MSAAVYWFAHMGIFAALFLTGGALFDIEPTWQEVLLVCVAAGFAEGVMDAMRDDR